MKNKHRITIETKSGRSPSPVISKWSCSCGAKGAGWGPNGKVNAEADGHVKELQS